MKKMNSVLSIRPIVILLCVVFLVFVMCGSAVAENIVYVPKLPTTGGDIATPVEPSLKTALESEIYDVVVLTDNISLYSDISVNNSKKLISFFDNKLYVNANVHTFYVPAGASLEIGRADYKVNINSGTGDYLFDVAGTLTINEGVNIENNNNRISVIDVHSIVLPDGSYAKGNLYLNGGSISGNNPVRSTVNIHDAAFTMKSGNITHNSAFDSGGVLVDTDSDFVMNGGNILFNSNGGVNIYYNGNFIMNGGKIANNSIDNYGGGVNIANGGSFDMNGGKIANNSAAYSGGGIYVSSGGEFNQNKGDIEFNTAEKDGGGVYLEASKINAANYVMKDGKLNNNTAKRYGGAVYIGTNDYSSKFSVSGGDICDNKAKIGGGVYLSDYPSSSINKEYNNKYLRAAEFTMSGGTIADNTAETAGGVYVPGEQVKMPDGSYKFVQTVFSISDGDIINNTDSPVIVSAGKLIMSGGNIAGYTNMTEPTIIVTNANNFVPAQLVKYQGEFEMSGGKVYNTFNHVNYSSTGIENYGDLNISGNAEIYGFKNHGVLNYGSLDISGGNIHDNKAKNGGGIYSENSFVMSGGTIASNTASDYGGGIFINKSLNMTGGKITGNHANYSGAVSFRNIFNMSGGEISNNYALSGGAFSLTDIANTPMTFNFIGGNIGGNTAKDKSGIYFTHGNFNLGFSGLVEANNNVMIGSSQRINVVSNLTNESGVYSIIPLTNSKQTVAVVSVPGKKAEDFIGNFDLYYKNSRSNYYNTLETIGLNIFTSHKDIPVYKPEYNDNIPGYATCSVTFDPMNGENATFVSVPFNDLVQRPEDPVYGSADFLGWFTAYEYEWNFETDTVMSPLTLYAEWYGVPSQKVSPIAVPESNTGGFQIPTILIAAVAAAVIAAAAVVTVVIIRKRRNSDDDDEYDDDE